VEQGFGIRCATCVFLIITNRMTRRHRLPTPENEVPCREKRYRFPAARRRENVNAQVDLGTTAFSPALSHAKHLHFLLTQPAVTARSRICNRFHRHSNAG
jgi:hypothetical protein